MQIGAESEATEAEISSARACTEIIPNELLAPGEELEALWDVFFQQWDDPELMNDMQGAAPP